ncbi:MAG: phosphatase PAP2 family protein [Bacteroidota bacterium]|jgi:hypothetical protein
MKIFLAVIFVFTSLQGQTASPYSLSMKTDSWIIGSSVAAGIGAYSIETNLKPLSPAEIASPQKSNINAVDRFSAGYYNAPQSTLSDVLVGISIASPAIFLADKRIRDDFFTLGTMYTETAMLAAIFPSLGKGTAKRLRPYVYNTSVPLDLRLESDAQRSFFSRHSSFAFSMAVLTSVVYGDYFPDSKYKTYVWIGSLGLASSIAVLRVTSGSHFISDVVVGAVVGSAVGYFIPYIHRTGSVGSSSMSISPLVTSPSKGFTVSIHF